MLPTRPFVFLFACAALWLVFCFRDLPVRPGDRMPINPRARHDVVSAVITNVMIVGFTVFFCAGTLWDVWRGGGLSAIRRRRIRARVVSGRVTWCPEVFSLRSWQALEVWPARITGPPGPSLVYVLGVPPPGEPTPCSAQVAEPGAPKSPREFRDHAILAPPRGTHLVVLGVGARFMNGEWEAEFLVRPTVALKRLWARRAQSALVR